MRSINALRPSGSQQTIARTEHSALHCATTAKHNSSFADSAANSTAAPHRPHATIGRGYLSNIQGTSLRQWQKQHALNNGKEIMTPKQLEAATAFAQAPPAIDAYRECRKKKRSDGGDCSRIWKKSQSSILWRRINFVSKQRRLHPVVTLCYGDVFSAAKCGDFFLAMPGDAKSGRHPKLKQSGCYGENAPGKWVRCKDLRAMDNDPEKPQNPRELDSFEHAFSLEEACLLDCFGGRKGHGPEEAEGAIHCGGGGDVCVIYF